VTQVSKGCGELEELSRSVVVYDLRMFLIVLIVLPSPLFTVLASPFIVQGEAGVQGLGW
jgi:hypothetical protein